MHCACASDGAPQREQLDSVRVRILREQAGEQLGSDPALRSRSACAYALLRISRVVLATYARRKGFVEGQRGHIEKALGHQAVGLAEAERLQDRKGMAPVLN